MLPITIAESDMVYSLSELAAATNDFGHGGIIGKGGFGVVYQGKIRHCHVAVKRLTEVSKIIQLLE